jgi:hypothetical protein
MFFFICKDLNVLSWLNRATIWRFSDIFFEKSYFGGCEDRVCPHSFQRPVQVFVIRELLTLFFVITVFVVYLHYPCPDPTFYLSADAYPDPDCSYKSPAFGSGSAFRIRIQNSQIKLDPESGFGFSTLVILPLKVCDYFQKSLQDTKTGKLDTQSYACLPQVRAAQDYWPIENCEF